MSEGLVAAGLLAALRFAADKHRGQRRKDAHASPYINHPIEVAEELARSGVSELTLLQAAILHDTIEDTETSGAELETHFGATVRRLVEEVTDDKSLPKHERKRLQIEHAPALSRGAQQIKLADKICNARDLGHSPPPDWPLQRCLEYCDWAEQVVAGLRGGHPTLEALFDEVVSASRHRLRLDSRSPPSIESVAEG